VRRRAPPRPGHARVLGPAPMRAHRPRLRPAGGALPESLKRAFGLAAGPKVPPSSRARKDRRGRGREPDPSRAGRARLPAGRAATALAAAAPVGHPLPAAAPVGHPLPAARPPRSLPSQQPEKARTQQPLPAAACTIAAETIPPRIPTENRRTCCPRSAAPQRPINGPSGP
jgi:hypothetical protein